MRIRNARVGDVVVGALALKNVFAGYLEGGPDAGRLWAALERNGATCVRFDPTISLEASSSEMIRRVPRWSHHARVAFIVDDEPKRGVVGWFADGVGDESIEEMLARGIGNADLTVAESPMKLSGPKHGGRFAAMTADGCEVGAYDWHFDFGPLHTAEHDLEVGDVGVATTLVGPDIGVPGRRGDWRSILEWKAVFAPGAAPLHGALAAEIARIPWRSRAIQRRFDDDDD